MIDSPTAFDLPHYIAGNGHRASRYARMNAPGDSAKYTTVHTALINAQLHEHLIGKRTYAAIIVGADGLVSVACIELDSDALDGARRVLSAAEHRGVVAFAVKGAGDHDGSLPGYCLPNRVQPEHTAE